MAEKAQIDFTINGGGAVNTLGELEERAASLREELGRAKIGSQAYKNLQQELIQTTKQVKNLELGFEALDREQVAGELGSVAGAVGDITAAVVLLGGENENLEAMVANIEKGIGISMAFKGAIEGLSSAWKLLNNVMRANPIGLIITAVALLIAGIVALIMNWERLGKVFTSTGKKLKNLTAQLGKNKEIVLALLGPLGWLALAYEKIIDLQEAMKTSAEKEVERTERLRRAQSKAAWKRHQERINQIKKEREEERKAFDDRQTIFDLEIDRMEAEGKNSFLLRKQKQEDVLAAKEDELQAIKDLIESWTKYYEDRFRISGKSKEEFLAMMKGQGIDLVALQEEANEKLLKAQQEIYQAESDLIRLNNEQVKESNEEIIESNEEVFNSEKNLNDQRVDFLKRLEKAENDFLNSKLTKEQQEINAVRDKYFTLIEEATLHGESTLILEEAQREALEEIQSKWDQVRADEEEKKRKEKEQAEEEQREKLKKGAQDLFNAANSLADHLAAKDLKRAKEKTARGEKLTKSEIKRLKRQDKIQKAFALAQIAADTARGIGAAVAAGAGLVFPFNLGAIASGVAAVIAGSVQAAQVLGESVEIPSPADVTGDTESAASGANDNVPNIEAAQFGSTLLNEQKVFVVESDITDVQNNVSVIEAQASFN